MDEDELWKKYKNEHNLNVDESAEHFHQWRKVFLMMMDLVRDWVFFEIRMEEMGVV